ncbi:hypothetical protein [Nocardia asteroides]|uniref:hypothetical protein n=1 Tax=Nocardia asteroides TaxID=1824 RepID=UPI003440406E
MVGEDAEHQMSVLARWRFAIRRSLYRVRCTITIVGTVAELGRITPLLRSRGWTRLRRDSADSVPAQAQYVDTMRIESTASSMQDAAQRLVCQAHDVLAGAGADARIITVCLEWPRLRPGEASRRTVVEVSPRLTWRMPWL